MYNKTIIEFGFSHDIMNYQDLVSAVSASAFGFGTDNTNIHDIMLTLIP